MDGDKEILMCDKCARFPAPTSNFPELGDSSERQATLYRCNSCGTFLEVATLGKKVKTLTVKEVKTFYPDLKVV